MRGSTEHSDRRRPPRGRRNPWWIPPFLGRVPEIDATLVSLLGYVALALFFENYDYSLLSSALKHIAEDLDIPETQLGYFTALIRLGAIPAFVLIPVADRLGRRRMFLAAVIGIGLFTFLTAFAQSAIQFVVAQMAARMFMLLASALAFVIVAEEFPAEHRGWGMGILAAVASVGHGLGALLFALVDLLPFGWRALYAIGLAPVLMFARFRGGVRETARFTRQSARDAGEAPRSWFEPLRALVRDHPGRGAAVLAIGAIASFGQAVVFAFIGYFVMTVHGWPPWQYSTMVIACGLFGIVGNVAGGRLADRFGRRQVGFIVLASFPLFAWMFFRGPAWSLPFTWILLVFMTLASNVITRTLSTELFPTAQRGTSAGTMVLFETLGAALGLVSLGLVTQEQGDLVTMLPVIASMTLISAFIVLLLPETSRRELEAITGDS